MDLDVENLMDIPILVLKMVQREMMRMEKAQKMVLEPLVDILKMQLESKFLKRK